MVTRLARVQNLRIDKSVLRWILIGGIFAAISSHVPPAWASPSPHFGGFGPKFAPVSDRTLDKMRGGFSIGSLNVTFGIQSVSIINGQVFEQLNVNGFANQLGTRITSSTFSITPLSQNALGTIIRLVQNGAGNTVSNGILKSQGLVTVIQNTQSNVKMQFATQLNMSFQNIGTMVQTMGMNNRLLMLH